MEITTDQMMILLGLKEVEIFLLKKQVQELKAELQSVTMNGPSTAQQ